jgi:hypothetical protein
MNLNRRAAAGRLGTLHPQIRVVEEGNSRFKRITRNATARSRENEGYFR